MAISSQARYSRLENAKSAFERARYSSIDLVAAVSSHNLGVRLGALDRSQEAIAVDDEVLKRYGEADEATIREVAERALNVLEGR